MCTDMIKSQSLNESTDSHFWANEKKIQHTEICKTRTEKPKFWVSKITRRNQEEEGLIESCFWWFANRQWKCGLETNGK